MFPQITGGIFNRNTNGERVNADALHQMTDDTGGRTEIVRGFDGLDAATARIADELSKQYSLGYSNSGEKDGRWHAIRVEVRDRRLTVRARGDTSRRNAQRQFPTPSRRLEVELGVGSYHPFTCVFPSSPLG